MWSWCFAIPARFCLVSSQFRAPISQWAFLLSLDLTKPCECALVLDCKLQDTLWLSLSCMLNKCLWLSAVYIRFKQRGPRWGAALFVFKFKYSSQFRPGALSSPPRHLCLSRRVPERGLHNMFFLAFITRLFVVVVVVVVVIADNIWNIHFRQVAKTSSYYTAAEFFKWLWWHERRTGN